MSIANPSPAKPPHRRREDQRANDDPTAMPALAAVVRSGGGGSRAKGSMGRPEARGEEEGEGVGWVGFVSLFRLLGGKSILGF